MAWGHKASKGDNGRAEDGAVPAYGGPQSALGLAINGKSSKAGDGAQMEILFRHCPIIRPRDKMIDTMIQWKQF